MTSLDAIFLSNRTKNERWTITTEFFMNFSKFRRSRDHQNAENENFRLHKIALEDFRLGRLSFFRENSH